MNNEESIAAAFIDQVKSNTDYDVRRADSSRMFWCVRKNLDESDMRTVTVGFNKGQIEYINCCFASDTGLEGAGAYFDHPSDLAELIKLCQIIKKYMKVGK